MGRLALFPNAVPIALYYGILGAIGIPLNPWTSLIGSIALGIAADDTIHCVARFNTEARRLADERRALLRATLPDAAGPPREFGRGDLVGEIGLLSSRRAGDDVRVLADVRLVRFDGEDLERLARRYPRTVALVYRHRNRIQSSRRLETTGRVG